MKVLQKWEENPILEFHQPVPEQGLLVLTGQSDFVAAQVWLASLAADPLHPRRRLQ